MGVIYIVNLKINSVYQAWHSFFEDFYNEDDMLVASCQIGAFFLKHNNSCSSVVRKFTQRKFLFYNIQKPFVVSTNRTNLSRVKMAKFLYPEAKRDGTKDVYHGVEVRIKFEPYGLI